MKTSNDIKNTWLVASSDSYYISHMEEMERGEEDDKDQNQERLAFKSQSNSGLDDQPPKKATLLSIVRNYFKVLLLIGLPVFSVAQEKEPLEIKEAFVQSFNSGSGEQLRSHFDEAMLQRNSLKKMNDQFERALRVIGVIDSMILEKSVANSFTYKAVHRKLERSSVVFGTGKDGKLTSLKIGGYVYKDPPIFERNTSKLILPFRGEWYTFWGGKTSRQNFHNSSPSSRGAFDFWVMGENGKSHRSGAKHNEDFYAFGKDIIAPADGKIVYALDGVKDNKWPAMNPQFGGGNVVLMQTANGEYFVFGHLKENSVAVKKGDVVKQGQLLGQCGNSGNSTEPHLHFQIQNLPSFTQIITGGWVHFEQIKVNGQTRNDYIPVKGDKVSN